MSALLTTAAAVRVWSPFAKFNTISRLLKTITPEKEDKERLKETTEQESLLIIKTISDRSKNQSFKQNLAFLFYKNQFHNCSFKKSRDLQNF
jgi:hypothetical protein